MTHIDGNRNMLSDLANFVDGFHPAGPPLVPSAAQMGGNPASLQAYLRAGR